MKESPPPVSILGLKHERDVNWGQKCTREVNGNSLCGEVVLCARDATLPAMDITAHIDGLIDAEIAHESRSDDVVRRRTAEAFVQNRRPPRPVTVIFAGGIEQTCWSVSRGDGTYRVIYLPTAGYFSLCVESDFGPLDIGVHGPALGCFGSV